MPVGGALSAEDDALVQHTLFWLVMVPFTAPMWFSLRGRRPDLAERVAWAMWFNIGQSVLVVAIVALAWWGFVALPSMVQRMVGTYLGN